VTERTPSPALWPFAARYIDLRAGRMHYIDEGQGEPIVLVHGTPSWSLEWRHVVRALSGSHRIIAADHLGFGLSERPDGAPYTPEWHAGNFAEFVERLGIGPFTLVVHDFGGPIALPLALNRPDLVKRLVVLNSWMWSFEGDKQMERAARIAGGAVGRLLYRWANFSLRMLMPGAYGDRRKLTPEVHREYLDRFPDRESRGAVLWSLAYSLLGSSGHFDSLWRRRGELADREALIIWGMRDPAFKPYQLDRWRTVLPSAKVLPVGMAGHWPQEEEPACVIDALREFVPSRALRTERQMV
jgi:haloalkane dehalogenase